MDITGGIYFLCQKRYGQNIGIGRFYLKKAKYFPDKFMLFKWTVYNLHTILWLAVQKQGLKRCQIKLFIMKNLAFFGNQFVSFVISSLPHGKEVLWSSE